MHEAVYLHLLPEATLPVLTRRRPFNAVVVATCAVTDDWQRRVSEWLVQNGCLYMMAWGVNCSRWDDTVDEATRKFFDPSEVPDAGFVMTTWHTDETLESVFWYAQFNGAFGFEDQALDYSVILDIGIEDRSGELLDLFRQSRDLADREP